MKKLFKYLIIATATLLAVSCISKEAKDYTTTVPDKSLAVMSVNTGALLDKSKISEMSDLKRSIKQTLREDDLDFLYSFVSDFSSESLQSTFGISPEKPVICSVVEDEGEFIFTASIAVTDSKTLCKVFDNADCDKTEVNGYPVYFIDNDATVAIGESAAVMTTGEKEFAVLLLEKETPSNIPFSKILNSGDDVSAWVNFHDKKAWSNLLHEYFLSRSECEAFEKSFQEGESFASLNFKDGKVELECSACNGEKVSEELWSTLFKAPSRKCLEYVPDDAAIVFATHTGKLSGIPVKFIDAIAEGIDNDFYEIYDNLVKFIDGDIVASIDRTGNYILVFEAPESIRPYLSEIGLDEVDYKDGRFIACNNPSFLLDASLSSHDNIKSDIRDGALFFVNFDYVDDRDIRDLELDKCVIKFEPDMKVSISVSFKSQENVLHKMAKILAQEF